MKLDFKQTSKDILKVLPSKQKEIISCRFGLEKKERETLEAIGKRFEITRERVRQIENDGLSRLEPEVNKYLPVFQSLRQYLKKWGNLRKEETLLSELGSAEEKNHIFFLLNVGKGLERFSPTEDFYAFWTTNKEYPIKLKENLSLLSEKIQNIGKPVKAEDLIAFSGLEKKHLESYLDTSKKIQKNSEGLYGLKEWPEISPKGIKDKAFLVFKKQQKPLHFKEVAGLIPKALSQTVHNELIKDARFVLVGRGIYALKEWGYDKGVVKDVIAKVLTEAGKPLNKEDIIDKVLKQRMVKENTVLLNLSDKRYFSKVSGGFFDIKRRTS